MICLSHTTGYAVHALSCLENGSQQPHLIRDVAQSTGLKKPYLAKIFNQLAHHGLVETKRGYRGGIVLARPSEEISLLQIVEAVEGNQWIGPCMLGLPDCMKKNLCPTHTLWMQIVDQITTALRKTTLADVISKARGQHEAICLQQLKPRGSFKGGIKLPLKSG